MTNISFYPRYSHLAGMTVQVGVESGVKTGLGDKGLDKAQLGKAIGEGLQRGITQVAIESATQKAGVSVLESDVAARFLSGVLDGIADPNKSIPQGVFDAMSESLKNTITLGGSSNDPYEQALYISKVIDFTQDIRDKGLEAALEKRAASVFSRDALDNIVRSAGSISNYIGKKEKEGKVDVIDYNGLKAQLSAKSFIRMCTDIHLVSIWAISALWHAVELLGRSALRGFL